MGDWLASLPGRFIVFDGPDGSGKTTQFERFARYCRDRGVPLCEVREPGGTPIGERIREVLLDPAGAAMSVRCEMLLFMASRAQLVEEAVRPALKRRELVLADRFISSTLAYQGAAGGLTRDEILVVGRVALGDCRPDLTVIFDVGEQVAAGRGSTLRDRMERRGVAYHRRVRQGFLDQAAAEPRRYVVLDASPDPDAVFDALLGALEAFFGSGSPQGAAEDRAGDGS